MSQTRSVPFGTVGLTLFRAVTLSLFRGLAWSPDGKALVVADPDSGPYAPALCLVSLETGEKRKLTSPPPGYLDWGPTFSPDGQTLAFGRLQESLFVGDLYLLSITAGRPAAEPKRLTFDQRAMLGSQWTPDGRALVFSSNRGGTQSLWRVPAAGGSPEPLGRDAACWPAVSRRGDRLAYTQLISDTNIYRVAGPGLAAAARPCWSRDGRWIYFGSNRGGDWQVWKIPAEGGPAVQVTRNGGREAFASADGKFVYYAKLAEPGIWRVPIEGGEETRVLDRGAQGAWALGEQGIFLFNDAVPAKPVIEFFSFSTLRPVQIATLAEEARPQGPTSLAVSPGDRWILYVQSDHAGSDIMLVENFR
ncbi:MAG: hypothetical protein AAB225_28620 [Acidobacteriota bacterium]